MAFEVLSNLKILQVTSGYPPMLGGVENSVHEMVTRLRSLNNEVNVITAGVMGTGLKDGVWRLPVALKIERSWGDLLFCPSIFNAMSKTSFDLVHAHTPRKLFAESVALYKLFSRRKFPYIVSIRLLNTSLTGFWKGLTDAYQRLVEANVFRYAKFVVVQSEFNKKFVAHNFKIAPEKIQILPNGVDAKIFDPDRMQANNTRKKLGLEGKDVILFSGRLTGQKGVFHLLRALQLVKKNMSNFVLLLAGDGPQEQMLRELSSRLGIQQDVVFLGKISHKDMPDLYSVADIFVLPSLSESFPNVMLEAMAMRKPIIITKVGVVPEILDSYKTAILVEPASPVELADAIIELETDKGLASKIGQEARALVCKKFTWERVLDQTMRMYEAALN